MKQLFTLVLIVLSVFTFANSWYIKGVIRDMDTEQPLQNAVVTISFDTGFDLSDTTDASGVYEIPTPLHLPKGDYGIQIKSKDYYTIYGFIKINNESYNEYTIKRKAVKEPVQAAVAPLPPVKPLMEGIATNNLVFLIDISASMNAPEKLPLLKESLKYLVNELRPTDRIAILTFSSNVKEVLPSTPVADKEIIIKTIEELAFGSTSQGGIALDISYKTALKNYVQKGNNRIILASDGLFTSGEKDYKKMEQTILSGLDKSIALSIFCYGKNTPYVTAKLKKLAETGKGHFANILTLEDGKSYMMDEARAVKN